MEPVIALPHSHLWRSSLAILRVRLPVCR